MKLNNRQRAKLTLDELEKEMEILTKEEMNACKGGRDYIQPLSGYTAGLVDMGMHFSTGIHISHQYQGSTGWLGGSGTDDDPYRLSEVVVTGGGSSNRYSSNFGGSLYYTGGWHSFYQGDAYNTTPTMGQGDMYGSTLATGGGGSSSTDNSSWNALVNGVSAFTFANGVKTELIGWASTMDEITAAGSKYLKFTKGLGIAGAGLQMFSSSANIYNDYSSGGISNVKGWDVADFVVSGGSIVAAFALGSNPVGWVVAAASGGYYLYRVLSEE